MQNRLYAPTYLLLLTERRNAAPPDEAATRKASSKKRRGKGKGVQRSDAEFDKERAWLLRKLLEDAATGINGAEEDEGEGFECGCCFSNYPFVCFVVFIRMYSRRADRRSEQDDPMPRCPSLLHRLRYLVRLDATRRT